jgi:NAD(P)-dependent dehydrogenase (short-subunit alcohol dehydrogenase family)
MSRILITGSADGLGKMAARLLVAQGHSVTLHARNPQRAKDAMAATPGATHAIAGDLSSIAEIKSVATQANQLEPFDAIIHNAAIGYQERKRTATVDGLPAVFAINSLAPYLLTCLIHRPKRLVYLSSGLHRSGDPSLKDLTWEHRPWNGYSAYSDSKLYDVILAFAGAPDNLAEGPVTQAWLAVSVEPAALTTGHHFYHKHLRDFHPAAADPEVQEKFLTECGRLSGVAFPMKIDFPDKDRIS